METINLNRNWDGKSLFYVFIITAGGAALLTLLYRFDPASVSGLPGCMFYHITGLYCPGCGSMRALHDLLHGEIASAFGHNALFVIILPVTVLLFFDEFVSRVFNRRFIVVPAHGIWALAAATIVFWVIRNIPLEPFLVLPP